MISKRSQKSPVLPFAAGGGTMGERLRAFPWASTALGALPAWPAPLRTAVRLMLAARQPMLILWGPSQLCLFNDAARRLPGSDKQDVSTAFGMPVAAVWPELIARVGPLAEQVLADGGSARSESAPWAFDLSAIDDDASASGIGGVLVACTEATLADATQIAQAESEARYRALVDQLPGGAVFVVDRDLRYVTVGGEALKLANFQPGDLLGRTIREALGAATAAAYEPHYRGCLAGKGFECEHEAHGRRFLTRGAPLRDAAGGVFGALAASYDITERSLAEERLQHATLRLEGVMAASEIGMWTWDFRAGVIEHDDNLARLYGLPTGRQSTPQEHYARFHPDDAGHVQEAIATAMTTGIFYLREYRVIGANGGADRWLGARGKLQRDADGNPTHLTGLVIDISDLKALEASLREADKNKDDFLAVLAHELRNPLAPLVYAERMLAMPNLPPERIAWCREVMGRQLQQMSMLLDDLLDISRIKRGTMRLRKSVVPLRSVIEAAIETAAPLLEKRGHAFTAALPPPNASVDGDPVRLAQVIANLLNNAAKYTDNGGSVQLAAAQGSDDTITVSISDNGHGLAPADRDRLAEMFAQEGGSLSFAGGGLGVGLALARQLVAMHGGTIRVESEGLGKGSTFAVTLPLASGSAVDDPGDGNVGGSGAVAHRVLIADDNTDAAEALSAFLQTKGFATRVARDGSEAVELFTAFKPDAALLDIGMPALDGHEVARRIRQGGAGAGILLIAVTARALPRDLALTREAGFDFHFSKPVDPDLLLSQLSDALAARGRGQRR